MIDQKEINRITEMIVTMVNEDLVDYFSFISTRIEEHGLTDGRELRHSITRREILKRMSK